jgi:hypothetical protein
MKEVARQMPEGQAKQALNASTGRAIAELIDDWCGTRHPGPHPWPGPVAGIPSLVSALGIAACSFAESGMRQELLDVAGRIVEKSLAPELR